MSTINEALALTYEPNPPDKNGQGRIGYTTVQRWLKIYKQMLAAHRKLKRNWEGTKEDFNSKETLLVGHVQRYRTILREPYYVEKLRKAYNRKRRKPLSWKATRGGNHIAELLARRELDREEKAHLREKLKFLALQIKRKTFKTRQALANKYRQGLPWVKDVLEAMVNLRLVSKTAVKNGFRGRGRPKKGKPRGPYKQKENIESNEFRTSS